MYVVLKIQTAVHINFSSILWNTETGRLPIFQHSREKKEKKHTLFVQFKPAKYASNNKKPNKKPTNSNQTHTALLEYI